MKRQIAMSPYFIVSIIFLALGLALAWLTFTLATQPVEVRHETRTYAEVVRPNPPDCSDAPDLYDCLNYRSNQ